MATSSGILGNERDPDDPIVDVGNARHDSQSVTHETATPGDATQPELALPGVNAAVATVRGRAPGRALGRSELIVSPQEQTRSRPDRFCCGNARGAHGPSV